MQIANIKNENKDYHEAIGIYRQILALTKSQAKPEAQYHIAEAVEAMTTPGSEAAINEFKLCAERYPDSEFAGASLAKLVDYHIETKDYGQANELLDQIFQDYPDAQFLDGMLLKWVIVAYRMNDFEKAYEKCSQLLFEYPESRFAERAKAILPKIEERVKK
jgi:TolA-binding protein